MSDLHHPCERWAESISLAAAGCLSPEEEQALRPHVATCADCREQLRQLTDLCRTLAEAHRVPPRTEGAPDGRESVSVERILSAVAAQVSQRPGVRTDEERTHGTFLSRSPGLRRWIMRSPVLRISAAAIVALLLGALAFWFHGEATTPALANFIDPIVSAKSVTFTSTVEVEGKKISSKVMGIASPQRMRTEQDLPGHQKIVTISDATGSLTLRPSEKLAIVTTVTNASKGERPKALFFELRSQLAEARDLVDWTREPLGEKVIDGRRLVGFRLKGHGMISDLWGDPKTGMPVRIENSAPSNPNMKPSIDTDFVFNAVLDESLFSLVPPAGYKVQKLAVDVSPAEEKDLVESFRRYAQLSGGTLPDQLDLMEFTKMWSKANPTKGDTSEAEKQEQVNSGLKLMRGLSFAFEQLPRDADAHYAGQGVKVGAADTPVFWYRTGEAKKYRVLYADLAVRDADTAPNVPGAQPVVSTGGPKK